jgi:hypothetical protein
MRKRKMYNDLLFIDFFFFFIYNNGYTELLNTDRHTPAGLKILQLPI